MPRQPDPAAGKEAWRSWSKRVRAALDLPAISRSVVEVLAAWHPLRSATKALFYLPLPDEVDLSELPHRLPGIEYLATRTPPRGGRLTIHPLDGPLEIHPFGYLQPAASAPSVPPSDVDVWLLPGLAFDRSGTRLGRGAGYFDELTNRAPDSIRAGVGPAVCVVDQLPQEPHDRPVQYLATETGVMSAGR